MEKDGKNSLKQYSSQITQLKLQNAIWLSDKLRDKLEKLHIEIQNIYDKRGKEVPINYLTLIELM